MSADVNWLGLLLLIIATFLPSETLAGYSIGNLCSNDADCPSKDATYCKRLTTVSPACQKGTCICRPGYVYDGTGACLQYNNLTIGQACSGAINEKLSWGANCSESIVTCMQPTYVPLTQTRCAQVILQPVYDQTCSPANMNTSCNDTFNFACNPSTNKCGCVQTSMIYQSSLSACRPRIYGDSCSAAADCDSETYTNLLAANGGADCISATCGCASGFTTVQRVSYDGVTKSMLNLCLKGYTMKSTQNATCTVYPEKTSADGALVCSAPLACIRCPEDATVASQGICRAVLSSSCTAIQSSALGAMTPDQVVVAIKACGGLNTGGKGYVSELRLIVVSLLVTSLKLIQVDKN